ncbi:hypothetical protein B0T18DRAFT_420692 [Schizothecium vesticola]|uniref:Uncharacterized protein n=1 Tax=Schizothecium vesticola TaxID=314040 RepID=A0AA40EFF2_9PEZI|nr:hypothetical protein B0T18DRAFT_420692 [Schizothecium vesticola]
MMDKSSETCWVLFGIILTAGRWATTGMLRNLRNLRSPSCSYRRLVLAHPSMWIPSSVTRRGIIAFGWGRPWACWSPKLSLDGHVFKVMKGGR